jgi:hypothetical protein
MSADRIIIVSDAVVDEINADIAAKDEAGNPLSPVLFTANRTYGAEYTNAELKTLRVDVRHPAVITGEESRGGSEDTYGIEIAVQQAVAIGNTEAIDALVILARRMARRFPVTSVIDTDDVPHSDGVQVIENQHLVFDPEKLAQGRFFSLISLTLREFASS